MTPRHAPDTAAPPDTGAAPCSAHAYSEASQPALDVLHVLSRWPAGLQREDMVLHTGLPARVITQALQGLKSRGRVVVEGKGKRSLWRCAHHAAGNSQAGERMP